MSQTSKIVLGVAVVAVIAIAGYWYWRTLQGQAPQPSAAAGDVTTLPSGDKTTDDAIEEDLASIDAQISAVHEDNADASQSVDAALQ